MVELANDFASSIFYALMQMMQVMNGPSGQRRWTLTPP